MNVAAFGTTSPTTNSQSASLLQIERDVAIDVKDNIIVWTPSMGSARNCSIEFKALPELHGQFIAQVESLLADPDLRVIQDGNPLSSPFAEKLWQIADIYSVQGCLIRGLAISTGHCQTFRCRDVTLIQSVLRVMGDFTCSNLNVTQSILDLRLRGGAIDGLRVDHSSRVLGALGTSTLAANCEIHGLAYELDFAKSTLEGRDTITERFGDAIFSRRKLKSQGFKKGELGDLKIRPAKQILSQRQELTERLLQQVKVGGPFTPQQLAAGKEPRDLVFTPKISEAPSQSYRGLNSGVSEDSQMPDLKSSWFSRGFLEGLGFKGHRRGIYQLNPQTIVKRIFSHKAEIPEEVKSLSLNPRQPGPFAIEDIAWPLELLSLPYVPSYEELSSLISAIDDVIAASGKSEAETTRARERVKQAYDFLRWPQNRARLELELEPESSSTQGR